ncbi:MAG: hypothetical protein K6L75_05280 [Cellvibrionaceae bacterium]
MTKTLTRFASLTLVSSTLVSSTLASSLLSLSLIAITPSIVNAETIQVPIGQQAGDKQNIKRPKTGLKSSQVEADFGSPINKTSAVGTPPISSWIYPEFIVYFEYDHVIHTVLKHTPVETN